MIISTKDFNLSWFRAIPCQKSNGGRNSKYARKYKDIVTAFDIETTRLEDIEQSIMYVWQWQFGNDITVVGRTWRELKYFMMSIAHCLELDEALVICVHNLSYEFAFLNTIYQFDKDEVFAIDSRKVLKCTMYDKRLEFRCTYLHSNMSLAAYTEKMDVEHKKLSEDRAKEKYGVSFVYEKKRYPWTELNDLEMEYIVNDVIGLVEAYQKDMERDHDNLKSIPLTSTGYVRRDCKRSMRDYSKYAIQNMFPDAEIFTYLRKAFRGGNTHANRLFVGDIVENVKSYDRSSSYPDVMINYQFPMSKFVEIDNPSILDFERETKAHKAILMHFCVTNVKLHDQFYGCPYLPIAKCESLRECVNDNGRVLSADFLITTMTDIDFDIFLNQYDFDDLRIIKMWSARYGFLPEALRRTIAEYYRRKTELKGVIGKEQEYDKSKALLNACYGMMVQNPAKVTYDFVDGHFVQSQKELMEILDEYKKRAFLEYQWGVWVCAWARLFLEKAIRLIHETPGAWFLYCDTDSVKFIGDVDFMALNKEIEAVSKKNGSYAFDPSGKCHFTGVYEYEETYKKFRTWGAKKYVYEDDNGLHCTTAGVNKKRGATELEEHGGIEAYDIGFVFRDAGGTESVYNDDTEIGFVEIDGKQVEIGPNIVIRPSTYTLSLANDYREVIENAKELLDIFETGLYD